MSHHLDSPLARKDPRLNITDHYLFDSDAAVVLVMDANTSLAGDGHDDDAHPEARYEFKIHLDGAPRESVTYRFAFAPAQAGSQAYTVERLDGTAAGDDDATGTVIARGSTGTAASTDEGGQVWVGRAVEPFFLDLKQLNEVTRVVLKGEDGDLWRWVEGVSSDTFTGSTVLSFVLTVPIGTAGLTEGRSLATWATSKLATDAGGWHQVGRTALPMIWPIFRDDSGDVASHSNETHPADDAVNYRADITGKVASVVDRLGTAHPPAVYAESVADRLVPDLLRYVVGTPALFGFAGFNGRRLSDNAPEVMFSLATNSAVGTGLRAGQVERSRDAFPFVVPATG